MPDSKHSVLKEKAEVKIWDGLYFPSGTQNAQEKNVIIADNLIATFFYAVFLSAYQSIWH